MFRGRFSTVFWALILIGIVGFWMRSAAHPPASTVAMSAQAGDQHFDSAQVQGNAQKINLDAVHRAFYETQGSDFNQWMQNFEQRVNEIYQGPDVVQVDADKNNGMIRVTGYIERNGVPGYQASGDETLFQLQQTGPVNGAQGFPYTMTGAGGMPYYQGYPPAMYYHRSLLDNPFVQYFVISHMLAPSWHYYTPPSRVTVIHHYVQTYRQTPAFRTQQTQNKGFFSRIFKGGSSSGLSRSSKGFGSYGSESGGTRKRSWFGGGKSGGSAWSGRRSSGGFFGGSSNSGHRSWGSFGHSSGGWGGRRSLGGGFSHSFGGRRRW